MENPLFRRINDYQAVIWKRKWWFLGVGVVLAIAFGYSELSTPTEYIAKAKFHPESESSSSLNLDNPVSLLFGGGMVPEESKNMIGILKSRRIAESVVGDTIILYADTFFIFQASRPFGLYQEGMRTDTVWLEGEEKIFLADKALELFNGEPSFIDKTIAFFMEPLPPKSLSRKIYSAGRKLGDRMTSYVGEEGFIDFSVTVPDAVYAKVLADKYILALRTYYQNQKTEKAKRNLDFFTIRADSIKRELDLANRGIANSLDKSRYRVMASEEIVPRELEAKSTILQQMYVNLMVSREQAVSQLLETTPILQVLDYPRSPFDTIRGSLLKGIIIGFGLSFLVLGFWFTRKLLWTDFKTLVNNSLSPPSADSAY
ncbi:MAG: hypothetical protein AB8H47_24900 [Bacteroidia bacterium]